MTTAAWGGVTGFADAGLWIEGRLPFWPSTKTLVAPLVLRRALPYCRIEGSNSGEGKPGSGHRKHPDE